MEVINKPETKSELIEKDSIRQKAILEQDSRCTVNTAYSPSIEEIGQATFQSICPEGRCGATDDRPDKSLLNTNKEILIEEVIADEPQDKYDLQCSNKREILTVGFLQSGAADGVCELQNSTKRQSIVPKTFCIRWLIVSLFAAYSMSNAYQWIHLNIIFNVIHNFYNASLPGDHFQKEMSIHWLSMIYMLVYIPLIWPVTWLLHHKGLRFIGITATLLNATGAWIKCMAISPDRFAVLMAGQTVCALAQVFILGIPARLAAVWFGPDEVSTATAIGVLGNQLGCAAGFLLPPLIVPDIQAEQSPASADTSLVSQRLSVMLYTGAGYCTLLLLVTIVVYRKEPPVPPSHAQILFKMSVEDADPVNDSGKFCDSIKRLLSNPGFVLLMVTYGINAGSYYAIGTMLNPMVLYFFPGETINAGRIGVTLVLAGIVGSFFAGLWLDKTKLYKLTTVVIYLMTLVGMVVFTFTLQIPRIWVAFVCSGMLGFFMTGYLPVGFEFAAEITYPESEGTSSGLLNGAAQLCGVVLTLGMGALFNRHGPVAANSAVCITLLLGVVGTSLIKSDLRRQRAAKQAVQLLQQQLEVTV